MGIKQRLKKLEGLVNVEDKEPHIIHFIPDDLPADFNKDECIAYQREVQIIKSKPNPMGIVIVPPAKPEA